MSEPTAPLIGRPAPDFQVDTTCGPGQAPRMRRLEDYRGRWLVLLFYPRDFSMICPTELSALSRRRSELEALGAEVLAVSTDTIETHCRWLGMSADAGGVGPLTFPLGSDPRGAMSRAYQVCMEPLGLALRGLFVIDPNSIMQYLVVHNMNVGRRTDEVIRVLTALQTGGLCGESWSPGEPTIDTSAIVPGTVVSHYRVGEKIGDGGFATVYVADDLTLGRQVAIKLLHGTAGWTPSLLGEARAAAALNHPNVCTVHGVDDSAGASMIVMEYLVGYPITRLLGDSSHPLARVAAITSQIAAGMTAAHAAGVVHGDLKPANVFMTDSGTIKILDFGLAARRTLASSGDPTMTGDDEVPAWIGTPAYMAPEQADGDPASEASDVFALGVIMFELLTGARAFGGDNVLQVLRAVRRIEPDQLVASLDEPFATLLRDMLAPDPRERRVPMSKVADVLQSALATLSADEGPPPGQASS